MNKDALEAAQRFAATRRAARNPGQDSAYYEAGARTSSHEDAAEVVRLWRSDAQHAAGTVQRDYIRAAWPQLGAALDALADGWRAP